MQAQALALSLSYFGASLAPCSAPRALWALSAVLSSQRNRGECGSGGEQGKRQPKKQTRRGRASRAFQCSSFLLRSRLSVRIELAQWRKGDSNAYVQRDDAKDGLEGATAGSARRRGDLVSLLCARRHRFRRRSSGGRSSDARFARRDVSSRREKTRLQLSPLLFPPHFSFPLPAIPTHYRRQADGGHRRGRRRCPGGLGRALPPRRLRRAALVSF